MLTTTLLTFQNLGAAVSLNVDQRFLDALGAVFLNWPFELSADSESPVFASVCYKDKRYTISSPFMEEPVSYTDPVNTICSMIVELAWAHLRADPSLLCLHGAAVEMNGRLVVFPNARRAGKSTLSVAMMAAGYRLYTDDFLPLVIDDENQICGISHGIAPRLRLPVVEQIGEKAERYINNRGYIANRQYQYVIPNPGELAEFGDTVLIGALVFLEQKENVKPSIKVVDRSETLKTLLTQNFSRAMNSDGILEILAALASNAPAYVMQYSDVEMAIGLLEEHFANWECSPAVIEKGAGTIFGQAAEPENVSEIADWRETALIQADGVKEISTEDNRFLSDPSGRNIHYLNAGATNIWRILEQPASVAQIVEILATVFPDQLLEKIQYDVSATVQQFVDNGLVKPAVADPLGNQPHEVYVDDCHE